MVDKMDYKKAYKNFYMPGTKPSFVELPPMTFIMVEGTGDPNVEGGEYSSSMEILYGLSYTIKMSKMGSRAIDGYFEYVIPPLEGLWWINNYFFDGSPIKNKADFQWISMIRQPEFVTPEVFSWAKEALLRKKPQINFEKTHFGVYEEGLCAQIMHKGSYDDEPESIKKLSEFIHESGYIEDISSQADPFPLQRRHHEIYLSDPRKTATEKLRTIIRHPVRKRN